MLLIPAAFAADLDAAKLLRAAAKGKDAATWLDADAAFIFEQRGGFSATTFRPHSEGLRLRDALGDPSVRALDVATLAHALVADTAGCGVGPVNQRWTASPGAAPELALAWAHRAELQELALVDLRCAKSEIVAVGMARTGSGGWLLAAALDLEGVSRWQAFADEAAQDVPAEREADRARLAAELKADVLSWSPPTLPLVKPNRDDIDGDGLSDFGVGRNRLYRSGKNAAEFLNGVGMVLVTGDVTGDGVSDLLLDQGGILQLRPGPDGFGAWSLQDHPLTTPLWVPADLDGDGRADLVEVQQRSVRVWFDGKPYLGASFALPASADAVAPAADLDGDGIDDLAIGMPSFGDRRGGVVILHGVRGSPQPRTSAIVGGYNEQIGTLLGATSAGLLVGTWDALRGVGRVDRYGGDGTRLASNVAPELLVEGCTRLIAGPEAGGTTAVCPSALRHHGTSGIQPLELPGLVGATAVQTADGPRIAAWSTSSLNFVGGADWSVASQVPLSTPQPTAPLAPGPDGVVGGVLGGVVGGVIGGGPPSASGVRTVHWSSIQMKKKPTPKMVPLPAGESEAYCLARITIGLDGHAEDVAFKNCPDYLRDTVREAVMAAAWYPMQPPERVSFDFRFIFKRK